MAHLNHDLLFDQVFRVLRDEPLAVDTEASPIQLPAGLGTPLSNEQIKLDLEQRFLIPKTSFPKEWLARCQQYWHREPDLSNLYYTELSRPRTTLDIIRRGARGEVAGYREVTVPDASLTAKNSTSLRRDPGSMADFVRGKGNFFPFAPGGLESEVMVAAADEVADMLAKEAEAGLFDQNEGLLTVAPGFERGLIFEDENDQLVHTTDTKGYTGSVSLFSIEDMMRMDNDFELDLLEPAPYDKKKGMVGGVPEKHVPVDAEPTPLPLPKDSLEKEVDNLLPTQPPPLLEQAKPRDIAGAEGQRKREWAHVVDINERFDNFHEVVPEMAREVSR
ncbi:hypothetical protein BC936DRAFT_147369 [Jimgerdemannia flammicorona]|uniref:Ski2 N-terminal domain-containing protein n=1 Tax=Jimgerdemannia flammicorona TaxID=994334 RepID=A0A433D5I6_9FUNG|nr:hypothetical protein BC936DRAFT_147369 [Jimgerdemannia flammicorona]